MAVKASIQAISLGLTVQAASAVLAMGKWILQVFFQKHTQHGFNSWAVLEWECCIKSAEQGAAEGAPFIASHLFEPPKSTFDDFAGAEHDTKTISAMIGLSGDKI